MMPMIKTHPTIKQLKLNSCLVQELLLSFRKKVSVEQELEEINEVVSNLE